MPTNPLMNQKNINKKNIILVVLDVHPEKKIKGHSYGSKTR
jgi:hypothetical protein